MNPVVIIFVTGLQGTEGLRANRGATAEHNDGLLENGVSGELFHYCDAEQSKH